MKEEKSKWINDQINLLEVSISESFVQPDAVTESLKRELKICQAIRRLIESHITDEQLFEIKAQEYERGLKDGKPEVDEGFLEKHAEDLLVYFFGESDDSGKEVVIDKLKTMLKEIPVRIIEKG